MEFFSKLVQSIRAWLGYKIEQQEDPVKLIEQNIRELKADLSESLKSLAEVKAGFIRTKRGLDIQRQRANDYESKAIMILEKAKNGEIDANRADALALQALSDKDKIMSQVNIGDKELSSYDDMVKQLESKSMEIKTLITKWEKELSTIKARAKLNEATKSLNQKLSQYNSNGTENLFQSLKDKMIEQEAFNESLAYVNSGKTSWENEVDKILGLDKPANNPQLHDALNQLKKNVNASDYKPVVQPPPPVHQPKDVPPPSNLLSELEKLKSKLKN
jgi:phage shock protein A